MESKEKLSIVCFSGDFDRAVAALTIATGAAATNREVTLFFTFWGLNIVKGAAAIAGPAAGSSPASSISSWAAATTCRSAG